METYQVNGDGSEPLVKYSRKQTCKTKEEAEAAAMPIMDRLKEHKPVKTKEDKRKGYCVLFDYCTNKKPQRTLSPRHYEFLPENYLLLEDFMKLQELDDEECARVFKKRRS